MNRIDERFPSMGSEARVRLESATLAPAELRRRAAEVRATLDGVERSLTRFEATSELSRFNADPRERVEAPPLVAELVRAALWAAEQSGGLVDAALLGELEREGYAASRTGVAPASLAEALAWAAPRRAARPSPAPAIARFEVDLLGRVTRPPGVRLDSGGLGKGLAADLAARRLPAGIRYAVSCGGDLALGGDWMIAVTSAFTGRSCTAFRCAAAGSPRRGSTSGCGVAKTAATPITCSTPRRAARRGRGWSR